MKIFFLLATLGLVIGDKWSSLKSPYLEKKARHRELKEKVFKKDTGYYQKPKVKVNTKKTEKEKNKKDAKLADEKFLKNEKWQLCLTVEEDNVKNTLLKFGLVTHMFSDVIKFRKTLKTLQDQVPTAKKPKKGNKDSLLEGKKGTQVKPHQGNWVGRSMGVTDPQFFSYLFDDASKWNIEDGSNYLGRRKKRQAYNFNRIGGLNSRQRTGTLKVPGEVPQCFGWKYLKALDALLEDNTVDTEVLSQSVSDMLDVNFSEAVSSIIVGCGDILSDNTPLNMCPPPEPEPQGEGSCTKPECRVDTDCMFREMCCRNSCGGYSCIKRSQPKSHSCQTGDQFMQCIYQKINNQLCADEN